MKQFQFIDGRFFERQRISEIDYSYRIYVPEKEAEAEIEKARREGISIGHAMRNKTEIDAASAANREAILDIVRQWNCGMLKDKSLYDAIESRGEQKPVGITHGRLQHDRISMILSKAREIDLLCHALIPSLLPEALSDSPATKPVRISKLPNHEHDEWEWSDKLNEIIDVVNTLMEKQA